MPDHAVANPNATATVAAEGRILGLPTALWVMTVSALLLRLAVVLLLADPASPDAMEHRSLAVSLLAGDGFAFNEAAGYTQNGLYEPSSVQSPPYPFFLAGLYALFGVESPAAHLAAMAANVLVGAMTVPLVYALVRRLAPPSRPTLSRRAALIAAGITAVALPQLYAVLAVQAVVPIVACTVGIALLWYVSLDTGRLLPWVAYGAVGCLAALTEPVLLPAMALSGVWVLFTTRLPGRLRLRNAAVLLACAVVFIGPWTWRNGRVHDAFVPIKATFWVNVWKGNNALDDGHSGTDRPALTPGRLAAYREHGVDAERQYDLLSDGQRLALRSADTPEREELFGSWAKAWIAGDPAGYAAVSGKRLVKTLWWDWDNPTGHQFFYAYPVWRGLLLIGSVAGLVVALRRGWRLGMPALIVGVSLLTYTLTITAARFAVPLEPFQYALVAALATALAGRWMSPADRPKMVETYLGDRRTNDGTAPAV